MNYMKKYVEVRAEFETDGQIRPLCIVWEDGTEFQIDRVLDVRPAASLKGGGAGIRYTVRIQDKERYVWLEERRSRPSQNSGLKWSGNHASGYTFIASRGMWAAFQPISKKNPLKN